jgi:hypothetical protein
VLANWTTSLQKVVVADARLGAEAIEYVSDGELKVLARKVAGGELAVTLPPLSCVLLEETR